MSTGAVQVDSKLTAPFQVVGLVECLGLGLVLQWHNSDFGAGAEAMTCANLSGERGRKPKLKCYAIDCRKKLTTKIAKVLR